VDWVCPRGSQSFYLPQVADLPGNWVGSVRVESQEWFTPGGPVVDAPMITAVAQLIKYADVQRSSVSEAMAYNLLPEYDAFDWQVGCCEGGLASGEGLIAIPSLIKDLKSSGVTSELAITNLVPKPGFTDFAIYVFDQNGLFDYVCQKLSEKEVEYIDLQTWGYVNQGFKGSALISAVYWDHDVFDSGGRFLRNLVGLGAVTVERTGTTLLTDVPGDEAAGSLGIPVEMPYGYLGPNVPICPGVPTILGRPVFCPPVVTVDSGAVGLMITDNQTTSSTISVTGIPTSCVVTDVNLFLNVRHPNNGQLAAQLAEQTPADTLTRQLYANLCSQTANTVTTLDDDSASPIGSVCPPIGGRYATGGGLDAFDGRPVAGDWTLRISDNAVGSQGSLQNWSLEIRTRQQ
jgi:subtilisin-like proprotein convertase family protein